jgi:hypothetical protein
LYFILFIYLLILGLGLLKQALCCLNHTSRPFHSGYFGDGGLVNCVLGWPQTAVFNISASQVARITGTSLSFYFCALKWSFELNFQVAPAGAFGVNGLVCCKTAECSDPF